MARVTLGPDVQVGARAVLQPGAVIGGDGFGFAPERGAWVKVPQVGTVRVGADVEIGANTTIDRGAIEDTVIEEGVKLDNQIKIGHNVRIGAHTVIAACTGISGSTTIGKRCMIGGHGRLRRPPQHRRRRRHHRLLDGQPLDRPSRAYTPAASRSKKRARGGGWSARFKRLGLLAARVRRLEQAARPERPAGAGPGR